MAVKKETFKVKDLTEPVRDITGLVKDNYLDGISFALSFWEENLKVLKAQVDHWFNFQHGYIKAGRELYEKLPKDIASYSSGNAVDRIVTFQKGYVDSIRKVSDGLTKEAIDLTQKNVENAFNLIDDYLSRFRA